MKQDTSDRHRYEDITTQIRVHISDPFVNINFEHNATLLKLKQQ